MRAAMRSAGFADEMEVATIDLISAMFFIKVLDEKVWHIDSSDALVSKNRTFVRNILLEKISIFHLKPPGGVLIEYLYVYTIYTIFVCIHDIHTQISFSKLNGGGLFKQPNRYIDLFERLREARTYIDRYLPGHISVSPRVLF